jgi:hypothetical protein
MYRATHKKVKILLIIILAIGTIGVVAYHVINSASDTISSFNEFQKAVKDKTAFNCEITIAEEGINYIVSTDNKWNTIFTHDNDDGMNTLYVLNDRIYLWLDNGQQANTYDYNSDGIGFLEWLANSPPQKVELSCRKPNAEHFSVPDKDWVNAEWEQETYEE